MELTRELELPASVKQEMFSVPTLSRGEYETLHMTIIGFSIKDIIEATGLTFHGVKWRLARMYQKFNAKDRSELIKIAALKGLCFVYNGQKQTYSIKVEVEDHEQKSSNSNRGL